MKSAEEIYVKNGCNSKHDIIEAMEEYAEQYKQKWIPVSSKPKEKGIYIGLTGLKQVQLAELYPAISETPPYTTILKFQDYFTHWMPLPNVAV